MRKFEDNEIYRLIRIIPLVVLSYNQFLFWEQGDIWELLQWSVIISSTIALIIFCLHIIETIDINNVNKKTQLSNGPLLLMHTCMIWSFFFHVFRIIGEIVFLII